MAIRKNNGLGIKIAAFFALVAIIGASYIAVQTTVTYQSRAKSPARQEERAVGKLPPWVQPTPTPMPPVVAPVYYLATTGWTNASPNVASTIIHGCNPGDMAISGGMDGYNGPINVWRTVRSGPSNSTDMNGWQTTVINQDSVVHQFTATTKCLKLTP